MSAPLAGEGQVGPGKPRGRRLLRVLVWVVAAVLFMGGTATIGWLLNVRNQSRRRAAWSRAAIQQVTGLSITNEPLRGELEELRAGSGGRISWTSRHLLLMTNGEYLAFASFHGHNAGPPPHLLIAHGSDGRWYYSSYHFCNEMAAVLGDGPPGSIAEFVFRYFALPFDPVGGDCLASTWEGGLPRSRPEGTPEGEQPKGDQHHP